MKKFLVTLQSICLTIILLDLVFYFVKGDYLFDTFIWRIIFFGVMGISLIKTKNSEDKNSSKEVKKK